MTKKRHQKCRNDRSKRKKKKKRGSRQQRRLLVSSSFKIAIESALYKRIAEMGKQRRKVKKKKKTASNALENRKMMTSRTKSSTTAEADKWRMCCSTIWGLERRWEGRYKKQACTKQRTTQCEHCSHPSCGTRHRTLCEWFAKERKKKTRAVLLYLNRR